MKERVHFWIILVVTDVGKQISKRICRFCDYRVSLTAVPVIHQLQVTNSGASVVRGHLTALGSGGSVTM